MMKNKNLGYAVLGILFVLISIIVFAIPTEKTGTFWIAYSFAAIAFVSQVVIWKTALGRGNTLKSKFLGLPVVHIGTMYLLVQIVSLALFVAVPTLPTWTAIVVCVIILGISAVCMIAGEAGRNEIERVETKVQKKVFFIKELQADVELLADMETDTTTKAVLQQLAEKIRFSDPMSSDESVEIDRAISTKIASLRSTTDKAELIQEIMVVATKVSEFLSAHAEAAYQMMGGDTATENAKYILQRITQNGKDRLDATEINGLCRKLTSDERKPALDILAERGYIREEKEPIGYRGREKTFYSVNPAVFQ